MSVLKQIVLECLEHIYSAFLGKINVYKRGKMAALYEYMQGSDHEFPNSISIVYFLVYNFRYTDETFFTQNIVAELREKSVRLSTLICTKADIICDFCI